MMTLVDGNALIHAHNDVDKDEVKNISDDNNNWWNYENLLKEQYGRVLVCICAFN